MRLNRLILCLIIFGIVCAVPAVAQGQVRTIPISSRGFVFRVSPDGQTAILLEEANIVAGVPPSDGVYVRLLNLTDGTLIPLTGVTDFARSATFTPDGSRVATYHLNGDVVIWNVAEAREEKRIETLLLGAGESQYLSDGTTLALGSGGQPGRILLVDTAAGAITRIVGDHFDSLQQYQDTFTGFPGMLDITYSAFAVSPDDRFVVIADANGGVRFWDITTGTSTRLVEGSAERPGRLPIRRLSFTGDGRLAYYDDLSEVMHFWTLADQTETTSPFGGQVFDIAPDGSYIAWMDPKTSAVYTGPLTGPGGDSSLQAIVPDYLKSQPLMTHLQLAANDRLVVGGFGMGSGGENLIYIIE